MREAGSLDFAQGHSPSWVASEGLSDGETCSIVGTDHDPRLGRMLKALRRSYGKA